MALVLNLIDATGQGPRVMDQQAAHDLPGQAEESCLFLLIFRPGGLQCFDLNQFQIQLRSPAESAARNAPAVRLASWRRPSVAVRIEQFHQFVCRIGIALAERTHQPDRVGNEAVASLELRRHLGVLSKPEKFWRG